MQRLHHPTQLRHYTTPVCYGQNWYVKKRPLGCIFQALECVELFWLLVEYRILLIQCQFQQMKRLKCLGQCRVISKITCFVSGTNWAYIWLCFVCILIKLSVLFVELFLQQHPTVIDSRYMTIAKSWSICISCQCRNRTWVNTESVYNSQCTKEFPNLTLILWLISACRIAIRWS